MKRQPWHRWKAALKIFFLLFPGTRGEAHQRDRESGLDSWWCFDLTSLFFNPLIGCFLFHQQGEELTKLFVKYTLATFQPNCVHSPSPTKK